MTSSSKIWGAVLLALTLLICSAAGAQPSLMQRGDAQVKAGATVMDVALADGNLVVKGRVLGSVFVVNGDVMLESGAVVVGNLTVLSGSLWVSNQAAVEGEINILAGKTHLEEGAKTGAGVQALAEVPTLTPAKLAIISRYLIFHRKVPAENWALADLGRLDPAAALRLKKVREGPITRLDLFDLGSAPFNLDELDDSYEIFYRGRGLRVRVAAVRMKSEPSLTAFWDNLRGNHDEKTVHSVHNSLAGGAHWFFRHRGASYALWRQGRTLMAVMVRHDGRNPDEKDWRRVEDLRDRLILELSSLY